MAGHLHTVAVVVDVLQPLAHCRHHIDHRRGDHRCTVVLHRVLALVGLVQRDSEDSLAVVGRTDHSKGLACDTLGLRRHTHTAVAADNNLGRSQLHTRSRHNRRIAAAAARTVVGHSGAAEDRTPLPTVLRAAVASWTAVASAPSDLWMDSLHWKPQLRRTQQIPQILGPCLFLGDLALTM
jgi:hypothetical protein